MSILKPYLILLTFTVVNCELNRVAFSNVTVIGSESCFSWSQQRVHVVSPKNLHEESTIRSFCTINDIEGPLTVLPSNSVTYLPKLQSFQISNGQLKQVQPGSFRNLPNLETIRILSGALEEVEEGVFNDLPIISLELRDCNISKIAPRALHNITNLQNFYLVGSNITKWDINWFQNTPNLRYFNIIKHKFEELPERAFKGLRNCTGVTVTFTHGPLSKVGDNLFDGLEEIHELDLQHNQIEVFGDGVLNGVKKMRMLRLAYNRINCISGDLGRTFVAVLNTLDENPIVCNEGCVRRMFWWLMAHEDHAVSVKGDCPRI